MKGLALSFRQTSEERGGAAQSDAFETPWIAPKRPWNLRLHLATVWLLANCAVVACCPGSWMEWFPTDVLFVLAWPLVALALPVAILVWKTSPRRRAIALATAIVGNVIRRRRVAVRGLSRSTLRTLHQFEWRSSGTRRTVTSMASSTT